MRAYLIVFLVVLIAACGRPVSTDPTPSPTDNPTPTPEASPTPNGPSIREKCFPNLGNLADGVPLYDQFNPVVGEHCMGTNHQDISGIEKVVFLGDSITEGTPPTAFWEYYRSQLTDKLRDRFGDIEVKNCSAWGARTDDLLLPSNQQILECLDVIPEPKRTLIIMTVGGNDMSKSAEAGLDGASIEEILGDIDEAVDLLRDAVTWLKDDERFPNGSAVIFSNIYEFTDGTGDFTTCPGAALAGFTGTWDDGRQAYIHVNEQYMKLAVDTDSDMLFMLEHFCGHGFNATDPTNECYRGPDTETWFDFTCIHPNPTGHTVLADMFMSVVEE